MGWPRFSEWEINRIRMIYAEDPRQPAKDVLGRFNRGNQRPRSLRGVQEVIQPLRGKLPIPELQPEWNASVHWGQETAEDMAFLLLMDWAAVVMRHRHLVKDEADWAKRLRVALDKTSPFHALMVIGMYVMDARVAQALNQPPPPTEVLDAFLQWRPWSSADAAYLYNVAVDVGLVKPIPQWRWYQNTSPFHLEQDVGLVKPIPQWKALARQPGKHEYGDSMIAFGAMLELQGLPEPVREIVVELLDDLAGVDGVGLMEMALRLPSVIGSLERETIEQFRLHLEQLKEEVKERRRKYLEGGQR